MAQRNQILNLIKTLANAYPEKKLERPTYQLYAEALAEVPPYLLEQAVEEHIRNSAWFPRIAELRQRALQIAGVRSFEAAPMRPVDNLRRREVELTRRDVEEGGFDTEAWEALAEEFERCGRFYAAQAVRRRIEFFTREARKEEVVG